MALPFCRLFDAAECSTGSGCRNARSPSDAAQLIEVVYRELPPVVEPSDALQSSAPQLWTEVARNLWVDVEVGDAVATIAAFRPPRRQQQRGGRGDRLDAIP